MPRNVDWMRGLFRRALLLVVLAALPALFAARPASAQVNRLPLVAVLDFTTPNRGDTILARQVTDAVVLELQRSGRYDVVPRQQLIQGVQSLGLRSPLERTGLQRLGLALGVDYIAIGRLNELKTDARTRETRAGLTVLFLDITTGEYANGASVASIALAPDKPFASAGEEAQSLRLQAIGNAAFRAAQTLNEFQLPQATVLYARDDRVLLNQGTRGGLRVGQEFIITRGNQRVGKVRIITVDAGDANAVVVENSRGIRPEDKARALVDPNDLP
jgi:hypothetical protein